MNIINKKLVADAITVIFRSIQSNIHLYIVHTDDKHL